MVLPPLLMYTRVPLVRYACVGTRSTNSLKFETRIYMCWRCSPVQIFDYTILNRKLAFYFKQTICETSQMTKYAFAVLDKPRDGISE